jgi:hypothetical protein
MNAITLLFAIALPVAAVIGAIAAWRMQKHQDVAQTQTKWRDDSLDDWREQREAAAEAERTERASRPDLTEGATEEREEARRQQRIGG